MNERGIAKHGYLAVISWEVFPANFRVKRFRKNTAVSFARNKMKIGTLKPLDD